jgi:hypothetical protein
MFSAVLDEVYGRKVSAGDIAAAISDMSSVQSVLRTRSGFKKKLLGMAERALGRPELLHAW